MAAKVLHTVAYDKIWYLKDQVVSTYLVKCLLVDGNVRSLEFHNDEGTAILSVEYSVGTAFHAVMFKADFVSQSCLRVTQSLGHPMREMLPYPFLGREHHPAAAHKVPDVEAVLAPFQSYVGRG